MEIVPSWCAHLSLALNTRKMRRIRVIKEEGKKEKLICYIEADVVL
jgi:hypothetical protein